MVPLKAPLVVQFGQTVVSILCIPCDWVRQEGMYAMTKVFDTVACFCNSLLQRVPLSGGPPSHLRTFCLGRLQRSKYQKNCSGHSVHSTLTGAIHDGVSSAMSKYGRNESPLFRGPIPFPCINYASSTVNVSSNTLGIINTLI
jgi:hypothetical protein